MVLLFWSKPQTLELDSELDSEPALELALRLPGWDTEQGMALATGWEQPWDTQQGSLEEEVRAAHLLCIHDT